MHYKKEIKLEIVIYKNTPSKPPLNNNPLII